MTTPRDPDRLIHAFLQEGAEQLHDQVYDAVRADIDQQRQRVVIGPWRVPTVSKLVPIALGAAAVIAVLLVGSQFIGSPTSNVGGPASLSPASVAPSEAPASAAVASPHPSLSETFTSRMHGISVSYPAGWTVRAATEPWPPHTGGPHFTDPYADVLTDPDQEDVYMFLGSQPIGDATPDEWIAERVGDDSDCSATEPITVDGAPGRIGADCNYIWVTTVGRGYRIRLYTSGDFLPAGEPYDRTWFEEVLATVKLHPEDAVD